VHAGGVDRARPAAHPVEHGRQAREAQLARERRVLLRARRAAQSCGDGGQRDEDVAIGVHLRAAFTSLGEACPARRAVDLGRESRDRAAAGDRLQSQRGGGAARLRARAPERQQLVDAGLGLLLGAAVARLAHVAGARSAVGAQDLAYALTRDAVAQRDLVEAPALLAQQRHLADALQRARRQRAAFAGRRVDRGGEEHRAGLERHGLRVDLGSAS